MTEIITVALAGIISLIVAIANNHFARRKNSADAAESIASAAAHLVQPLEARLLKVEKENVELRQEVSNLKAENERLRTQVDEQQVEIAGLRSENETLRQQIQRPGLAKRK